MERLGSGEHCLKDTCCREAEQQDEDEAEQREARMQTINPQQLRELIALRIEC